MARKKRTGAKKSVQRVKVTHIKDGAVQLIHDTNDAVKCLYVSPSQDRNEAKTNVDSWSDKYDQEMNNNVSSVEENLPIYKFTKFYPLDIEDEICCVVYEPEVSELRKETFYPHQVSPTHGADIMKSTEGGRCRRASIVPVRRSKKYQYRPSKFERLHDTKLLFKHIHLPSIKRRKYSAYKNPKVDEEISFMVQDVVRLLKYSNQILNERNVDDNVQVKAESSNDDISTVQIEEDSLSLSNSKENISKLQYSASTQVSASGRVSKFLVDVHSDLVSCIIREPLNPCHDHDKITPIKLHERCQVHDRSDKSPSESTQDFELPSSDGSSRNTAVTHTEGLREDDSTSKLLNDEKISQHLVESIEASTFEKEQDLLHIAFQELEVRLIIFDISVKFKLLIFSCFSWFSLTWTALLTSLVTSSRVASIVESETSAA